LIEHISKISRIIGFESRQSYKNLNDEGRKVYKIVDSFLDEYCAYFGFDANYVVQAVEKFIIRYKFDMDNFIRTGKFPYEIGNNNFDLTREEYDLFLISSALFTRHRFGVLKKISNALLGNGVYLMIENFLNGQSNLNLLREQFGLTSISIREHNLFFNLEKTKGFVKELGLEFVSYDNISSLYYLVSSKICLLENKRPDYYDIHHELASQLPISGDFGPIAMCEIKKRKLL
jgi:hypothetical protein